MGVNQEDNEEGGGIAAVNVIFELDTPRNDGEVGSHRNLEVLALAEWAE